MKKIKVQIIGIILCFLIISSLYIGKRRKRKLIPHKTIHHSEFRKNVKNGDLLGTLSSNNIFSRIHSIGLGTPIAHVGIAIVNEDDLGYKHVYIFESGAIRGAQLRNIDDYMNAGACRLWWRHLKVDEDIRNKIILEAEKMSSLPYSWEFLRNLPYELFGIDPPGYTDDFSEANSCGDMIAKLYGKFGIVNNVKKSWLPMHFLEKLPYHENPVNVLFDRINSD